MCLKPLFFELFLGGTEGRKVGTYYVVIDCIRLNNEMLIKIFNFWGCRMRCKVLSGSERLGGALPELNTT